MYPRNWTITKLIFEITAGNDSKTADDFPRKVLFSLAQKFEQPVCADVEFIFPPAADGTAKRLYAISTILENRSSYFSRSILPGELSNVPCSIRTLKKED